MNTAYISIGSNIGDKLQNCQKGIEELIRSGASSLKGQSRFYMTEPVGYTEQDWFINAVIEIETRLNPFELFRELKSIEKRSGRSETVRFGPRILDMDIIFYGHQIVETPDLVIPHPRMHLRRFVLQPICDINPSMLHPVLKQDMHTLLAGLSDKEQQLIELKPNPLSSPFPERKRVGG